MPHEQRPTHGRYGRRWSDGKAPDGFTVNGWRQIHRGGYVRFLGSRHYHKQFAGWVGQWVFVEIADRFALEVNVWPVEPWKDHDTVLYCINEHDWFSEDQKEAANGMANVKVSGLPQPDGD